MVVSLADDRIFPVEEFMQLRSSLGGEDVPEVQELRDQVRELMGAAGPPPPGERRSLTTARSLAQFGDQASRAVSSGRSPGARQAATLCCS